MEKKLHGAFAVDDDGFDLSGTGAAASWTGAALHRGVTVRSRGAGDGGEVAYPAEGIDSSAAHNGHKDTP